MTFKRPEYQLSEVAKVYFFY